MVFPTFLWEGLELGLKPLKLFALSWRISVNLVKKLWLILIICTMTCIRIPVMQNLLIKNFCEGLPIRPPRPSCHNLEKNIFVVVTSTSVQQTYLSTARWKATKFSQKNGILLVCLSVPMIRVRILLTSKSFSLFCCKKKTNMNAKEARIGPFKKDITVSLSNVLPTWCYATLLPCLHEVASLLISFRYHNS